MFSPIFTEDNRTLAIFANQSRLASNPSPPTFKMAEEDVFGDPKLFEEFERPREPSDRFLLETVKTRNNEGSMYKPKINSDSEEHENNPAKFVHGSSSDGEIESDEDSENNRQLNVKSNKNGGIEKSDSVNGIPDKKTDSKVVKGTEESVSDNTKSTGSDNFVIHDLQREIERLKKESILFL